MNPNLDTAILQFLGNEFHVNPEDILPDTDFSTDFSLTPEQLTDLVDRMQDALEFIIPEEKIPEIKTVGDLLASLKPESENAAD